MMAKRSETGYDAAGQKVINVATPTNPQDAATKNYVDTNTPVVATQRTFSFFMSG